MKEALAQEILDAYNNTGAAVKKRDETHRMAKGQPSFCSLSMVVTGW